MLGNSCWEENSRSRDWREPFNWPFWKNISIVWTLLLHLLATEFVHTGCHRPLAHPIKRVTANASDPMRVCASVTHLAGNARRTVISGHLERPHYVSRLLLCCLLSCGLWYVDVESVRCPTFTLARCVNERLRSPQRSRSWLFVDATCDVLSGSESIDHGVWRCLASAFEFLMNDIITFHRPGSSFSPGHV